MAKRPRYANNQLTLAKRPRDRVQPTNLPYGNAKGEQPSNGLADYKFDHHPR
ncbi:MULTISPECIES: hypothetical protein [Moorena]|uniref:hypothetical protein n=1 Tax=Moorena TaxID=1155738 RepID=UPI00031E2646|nr:MULTISPECIES: hypothetical protein [Moorena]NEP64501.1 hypothetical protein [Moorena sp. SIO3A5]NEQ11105.1 hypothetical protein [Moorena sp. SIO4E2]NEQ15596.1 hypothetical protein [Moorena sp. SIO3E2]NES40002.1 hypothetical protein [Moorena sp. SIO2C4]